MIKKIFFLIFILFVTLSCHNSTERSKIKTLNDSVINLMISFQGTNDSIALNRAIELNLKSMQLDQSDLNILYCKNTRCQLLFLSGQYKAAFRLKKELITNEFDKKIALGLSAELENKQDSSIIYYNEALKYSNLLLEKDPTNFDSLLNKIIALIYLRKIESAKEFLKQKIIEYPEKTDFKILEESLDQTNSVTLEFIQKLKS